MKQNLNDVVSTFVTLLPEYLPVVPGNASDLNRLFEITYQSYCNREEVSLESIKTLLANKYPDYANELIDSFAHACLKQIDEWSFALSRLRDKNLLILPE